MSEGGVFLCHLHCYHSDEVLCQKSIYIINEYRAVSWDFSGQCYDFTYVCSYSVKKPCWEDDQPGRET